MDTELGRRPDPAVRVTLFRYFTRLGDDGQQLIALEDVISGVQYGVFDRLEQNDNGDFTATFREHRFICPGPNAITLEEIVAMMPGREDPPHLH